MYLLTNFIKTIVLALFIGMLTFGSALTTLAQTKEKVAVVKTKRVKKCGWVTVPATTVKKSNRKHNRRHNRNNRSKTGKVVSKVKTVSDSRRSKQLDLRESSLNDKAAELKTLGETLNQQKIDQEAIGKTLTDRETKVSGREKSVADKEAAVKLREDKVAERETAIQNREDAANTNWWYWIIGGGILALLLILFSFLAGRISGKKSVQPKEEPVNFNPDTNDDTDRQAAEEETVQTEEEAPVEENKAAAKNEVILNPIEDKSDDDAIDAQPVFPEDNKNDNKS